jgi:hypothetical protein
VSREFALVFRVEYDEALTGQSISISIHTEDGKQIVPSVKHEINAGHAPGTRRGAPTFVSFTLTMNLVQFDEPGSYYISVMHEEDEMTRIPITLQLPPAKTQIESEGPDKA